MTARTLFLVVLLPACLACRAIFAQANTGAWRAAGDCFIEAFVLGDRGVASLRYSDGAREEGARWTWGSDGLRIVSDRRGVLLMNGRMEDTTLVADVDYSTTDDIDFRTCRFGR